MMNVVFVAKGFLFRSARPSKNILMWMMVVIGRVSVIERRQLGLYCFKGLGVSVLGAKIAVVHQFMMGRNAMLGDPGQLSGGMLEVVRGLVGAFSTYSIEALEATLVG